jgi:hypothetical protein
MSQQSTKTIKQPIINFHKINSIKFLKLSSKIFQTLALYKFKSSKTMAGKHATMQLFNGYQNKKYQQIKNCYSMVLILMVKMEYTNQDLIQDMLVKTVLILELAYILLIMQLYQQGMPNPIIMVIAICSCVG